MVSQYMATMPLQGFGTFIREKSTSNAMVCVLVTSKKKNEHNQLYVDDKIACTGMGTKTIEFDQEMSQVTNFSTLSIVCYKTT